VAKSINKNLISQGKYFSMSNESAHIAKYGVQIRRPNGDWKTVMYFNDQVEADRTARVVHGARVLEPDRPETVPNGPALSAGAKLRRF
jgi:hypothetical protein